MKNLSKFLIIALIMVFALNIAGVSAQSIKDRFNGILVDHDAIIGGDLTVSGDTSLGALGVTGDLTLTGDTTLTGLTILSPDTQVVITDSEVIPTTSYIVLTSVTSALPLSTASSITTTGMTTGQIVTIRNGNAADTIVVDGTGGTVECKADVTLGASDTITLIFNGTEWNCLSVYDNS